MNEIGAVFTFEGVPVGMFRDGVLPVADGTYTYEPFRSPGHYKMHQQRESAGIANCQYKSKDGRVVSFLVVGLESNGVLKLAQFQIQNAQG